MDILFSTANSILAVVVVLGLCLFFHELGHFAAAKLSRMRVIQFSMGFGPALWRRERRGTLYALRAIPFGGFVQIAGMEPGEADVPDGFHSRPRWQGFSVLCAGTFMNVVLAVLLYWAVAVFSGIAIPDDDSVIVRSVFRGSRAEQAGVRPSDKIIGVAGSDRSTRIVAVSPGSLGEKMGLKPKSRIFQVGAHTVATPADVLRELKSGPAPDAKVWIVNPDARGIEDALLALPLPDPTTLARLPAPVEGPGGDALAARALGVHFAPMDQMAVLQAVSRRPGVQTTLTVLRGNETLDLVVTPQQETARVELVSATGKILTPHRPVGRVGIVMGPQMRHAGIVEGLKIGVQQSVAAVATVIISFKAMLAQKISAEPAGPVGIMAMSAETAKLGWASVLGLCALISANLAVVNMLPIPPFDGYLVAQLGVEAALRRRISKRLELLVRFAGVVAVLGLFLYLTLKDTLNLIRYGTP